MSQALRKFEAKNFENKPLDGVINFVHDIFQTPFASAIGASFASFFAASMILSLMLVTQDALAYMSMLA